MHRHKESIHCCLITENSLNPLSHTLSLFIFSRIQIKKPPHSIFHCMYAYYFHYFSFPTDNIYDGHTVSRDIGDHGRGNLLVMEQGVAENQPHAARCILINLIFVCLMSILQQIQTTLICDYRKTNRCKPLISDFGDCVLNQW